MDIGLPRIPGRLRPRQFALARLVGAAFTCFMDSRSRHGEASFRFLMGAKTIQVRLIQEIPEPPNVNSTVLCVFFVNKRFGKN